MSSLKEFKIRRVLVPTDFSDTAKIAVKHAIDIAKQFEAELKLLHVLDLGAYQGVFSPSNKTEYSELEEAQKQLLKEAKEIESEYGIKPSVEAVSGRIHDEIVAIADKDDVDITVMGTHGVSGWEEFFVGSNAYKVVTQSSRPVLTVQEQATADKCENIILPIDKTPESRQKVRYAATLAKKFGSTIHIASLVTDNSEDIRKEFATKIKHVTDYFTKEGIPYTETILTGSNLAAMTMNFAKSKSGNLIVMMTEQEFNVTGFLIGPFAQQIVNHSKIPVLSISPEELSAGSDGFHALG